MNVRLSVLRRESPDAAPRTEHYELEAPPNASVLDCLERVALEIDPTLAVRENCFAEVCGECGVRVDGVERLACKTRLVDLSPGAITIEPLRNHAILRDLVVDRASHFRRQERAGISFLPGAEVPVTDGAMAEIQRFTRCTNCGLCVSACASYPEREDFVGPAALAWTLRFLRDPRDRGTEARRALAASPAGVAGCVDCGRCNEVCPEGVAPYDAIRDLR